MIKFFKGRGYGSLYYRREPFNERPSGVCIWNQNRSLISKKSVDFCRRTFLIETRDLKGRHQWCSAQRIKISMVAGGNHTIDQSADWCKKCPVVTLVAVESVGVISKVGSNNRKTSDASHRRFFCFIHPLGWMRFL